MDCLVVSSSYVLMALGMVLVFSIMGLLNFAHGQFYMMGAYVLYVVYRLLSINFLVSILVAAAAIGFVGVLMERTVMRPIHEPFSVIGATIGMIGVFEGLIVLIFGPSSHSVPVAFKGNLVMGNVSISNEKLATVIIAVVLIIALYLFLQKTKLGLAVRAAAQEPVAAGLFGIKAARVSSIVMGMGCGLAAIAGGVMSPLYYISPWIGGVPMTMAMLAIVVGGMGSLGGAVLGGVLFGILDTIVAYYVGFWAQLMGLVLVIMIILFRPQGLFGMAER